MLEKADRKYKELVSKAPKAVQLFAPPSIKDVGTCITTQGAVCPMPIKKKIVGWSIFLASLSALGIYLYIRSR